MCLVLFADGYLLVFDLQQTTTQDVASTSLARLSAAGTTVLPCCMEVASTSSTATSQLSIDSSSSGSRSMRLRTTSSSKAFLGAGNAAAHAGCVAAVGYSDGSTVVYDLAIGGDATEPGAAARSNALQVLQQLLAGR
jgi:hypothetical protein